MNGSGRMDWKLMLALAGGSFFANLIAVTVVVSWMTAGLRADVERNITDIMSASGKVSAHEKLVGHPGSLELTRRMEDDIRWIRDYLERMNAKAEGRGG